MVQFNVNPTDRPTVEDAKFWAEQANSFAYHQPNPRAPGGSLESLGWGIPPERMPPKDAISYVMCRYREQELGLRLHTHTATCSSRRANVQCDCAFVALHPMFKWSFLSVVMAHFLWFRTTPGAKWIMALYGVQEVAPFSDAYAYYWVNAQSGKTVEVMSPNTHPVYGEDRYTGRKTLVSNIEMRIFREWERCLDPACSAVNTRPVEQMKALLSKMRCPHINDEVPFPADDVWYWVSEAIRDWFLESKPNKEWPTHKPDRITGWQWVRALERAPGVPFFDGMAKVPLFKGRAYRLKDPRGGVYWCGGSEIRIVPIKDLYQAQGVMDEPQVEQTFRCMSCRKRRPCVPSTGSSHRCCHCFAIELEGADRPSLQRCTMSRECKACPDVLHNNSDLVRLKESLRYPGVTGPVPR